MEYKSKIGPKTEMRDAVFDRLYDLSEKDKEIVVITADHRANSLNRWKTDRKAQYRDVGISEDAAVQIAGGMAHEGKKVFIYAISPFLTSRIHESHKLQAGIMGLPYNIIGVGAGFSYEDSGPTHHTLDDISIMRPIPNLEIYSPSDSQMAAELAEVAVRSPNPTYLRLDRDAFPLITKEGENLEQGFKELIKGKDEICFISTGNMVIKALGVRNELSDRERDFGVIDLYRLKPLNEEGIIKALSPYKKIITLEEHTLAGGLGSMIAEMITDYGLPHKLKRIGIKEKDTYRYLYLRPTIHRELGLDSESIMREAMSF